MFGLISPTQGRQDFYLLNNIVVGDVSAVPYHVCCQEFQCAGNEPAVRFPFRIKGRHSDRCGYRGFDLSCTQDNKTMIELPFSVQLLVNDIDYISRVVQLYDPAKCLLPKLHNLNLSDNSQPFRFIYGDYDRIFFNCSSQNTLLLDEGYYLRVPCLSSPTYNVFAIPSYKDIGDVPLLSCIKLYGAIRIPSELLYSRNNEPYILNLTWSEPDDCQVRTNCTKGYEVTAFWWKKLKTAGIILGSFASVPLAFALHRIYASYRLQGEKQEIIERFLEDYKAQKPTRYSHSNIKKITDEFSDKLGQGSYGTVFKGMISKEILVAVKVLSSSKGNGEDFVNEVKAMGKIHHVNVVRLVGFCADGFRRALVYEFLPNGSLEKYISSPENEKNFLGWTKVHDIALGIAKGIEYLHQGCDQRILHFDIKPHNVLLDEQFNPKICDFGLSKLCSKDQSLVSMTTARGTLGYIAPEVFSRNFGNVSYKADVYSYGMLLLEMIGGRKNMDVTEENDQNIYYPEWIYNLLEGKEDVRIHIEDERESKIAKKCAIVGLQCIQWHPMDRPSMKFVVQMLEGSGDKLAVPPNPFAPTNKIASKAARSFVQDLDVIHELE